MSTVLFDPGLSGTPGSSDVDLTTLSGVLSFISLRKQQIFTSLLTFPQLLQELGYDVIRVKRMTTESISLDGSVTVISLSLVLVTP